MSFPPLERSLEKISNRYLLVVLAAKRSRQINRGSPPQIESKRKKWTSMAVEEIIAGKLYPRRKDKEEVETARGGPTET
jgi:DNA-directed RNA polymerase subunit omega